MIKSILAAVALATLATASAAAVPAVAIDGHVEAAALPTIASPIEDLLANPATAAVLEEHLPDISKHPALAQFQHMSLADVMPFSEGEVTPEIIAAIDADLKALPAPTTAAAP